MICAFLKLFAGHFENILSNNHVNDQTKILVVNAAYFIGKWMKKFPESETKECPFRVNKVCGAAGRRVPAIDPKMTATDGRVGVHPVRGMKAGAVCLPWEGRTTTQSLSLFPEGSQGLS